MRDLPQTHFDFDRSRPAASGSSSSVPAWPGHQAAEAGRMTMGLSLKGAMVSSGMYRAHWTARRQTPSVAPPTAARP